MVLNEVREEEIPPPGHLDDEGERRTRHLPLTLPVFFVLPTSSFPPPPPPPPRAPAQLGSRITRALHSMSKATLVGAPAG